MGNFLHDNDDLQYYLQEGIDWEAVASVSELGYRQPDGWKTTAEALGFYREVAALVGEPDAGSDMAALRVAGAPGSDGGWTVTGQKIFITSGHGKYHFVIARTEKGTGPDDPRAGLGGLSMFLVRGYREGEGARTRMVTLDRVEEKLGHHGSATVAVSFDHAPAELVGKRGEGFRQMLEIMNHARLAVGFESIGL